MSYNFSPKIVTDSLVLYLDAANTKSYPGTGTVWTDLSRSGINGTLVNMGSTGFSSSNGGVIVFDGSNDYVNLSNILNFERTDSFSINVWLTTTSISTTQVIISKWVTNGYEIFILNPGKIGWTLANSGGGVNQIRVDSPNNAIIADEIFNVCATYNGNSSTSGLLLYKNGVLLSTTSVTNNLSSTIVNSVNLRLGALGDTTLPLSGKIFMSSIYNKTLSSTEVLQNYNALKGRYGL